ncbi:MAG: exonuclease subunit SbcD [Oceanospirillaceae bacterium]|nr:exonuclease subunit SbcD [Oceanospirillaceae bacterium]
MRILHSSDWHLGQHFMGKSREAEHRAFLGWLIETAREHRVDALIVAGDIFDTGTPPSYARRLYNHFIVELRESGCQLVVLGGNHDSVSTLHESRELLACLDTVVIGGVAENPEDQVIELHRRDGTPGAVLCAIPYLRPRDLIESHAGESREHKREVLMAAIRDHYTVIYECALQRRDALLAGGGEAGEGMPIIATGHLTTVGGQLSESVRELYIGTLDAFPAAAFPPVDYMALGHLHRAQVVGGSEHIRYSGSPIALSFDESTRAKQVLMVDFSAGALTAVTPLEVPAWQPMLSLSGSLDTLATQLEVRFGSAVASVDGPVTWLEVEIEADDYLSDLQQRVQQLVDGLPVEVLRIRRKRSMEAVSLDSQARETLQELSVDEVFRRRLALETLDDATETRLQEAFDSLCSELEESLTEGER